MKTRSTEVQILLKDQSYLELIANVVPIISATLQRKPLYTNESETLKYLVHTVDLADTIPIQTESTEVDFLIGNDYYLDLILPQQIPVQSGLYLLGSKLGLILTGSTGGRGDKLHINMLTLTHGSLTSAVTFINVDDKLHAKPDLEDFWNIVDKEIKPDDQIAMDNFRKSVIFEDKRYRVTWPWKENRKALSENREIALGRLRS